MKLDDYKVIFITGSNTEGQEKAIESLIRELIRDDLKNGRKHILYISPLKADGWLSKDIDKDELINYSLKILTFADEVYVLPERDEEVYQIIGVAKNLGLEITYL